MLFQYIAYYISDLTGDKFKGMNSLPVIWINVQFIGAVKQIDASN